MSNKSEQSVICTRLIDFDAAHRVIGHENKCKFLHGHRYRIEASFKTSDTGLDELGRVIDFGTIKSILGDWIMENWDHNAILSKEDSELGEKISLVTGQKIYFLPHNPTAENMALYLFTQICPKLFAHTGLKCHSIRIYETPNCFSFVE